jgi:biopolymer transport protein TolR
MAFGRFERSQGAQPMSDINVTPLVDVMLVLVVILMITAPLLASSIKLDLPRTDAAKAGEAPKFVTLVVDKSGQAFLDDKPLGIEALATVLAQTAKSNPDTEVQLRADAAVPYGRIVEVMGTAQQAGLNRIGFVADPLHQSAPVGAAGAKP